jgi:hypothetical protein
VLRYTFDEASTGSVNCQDSGTGEPANATFRNGATRVRGVGNSLGALDLTGGSQNFVSAEHVAKLSGFQDLTVCAWVNMRDSTTSGSIIASIGDFTRGGWTLSLSAFDPAHSVAGFEAYDGNHSGIGMHANSPINADKRWVFVAGVFNWSTRTITVFQGGMDQPMYMATGMLFAEFPLVTPGDATFTVGPGSAWIDEVRVYDRALTISPLESIRRATIPEPCTNLVAPLLGACFYRRAKRRGIHAARSRQSCPISSFPASYHTG